MTNLTVVLLLVALATSVVSREQFNEDEKVVSLENSSEDSTDDEESFHNLISFEDDSEGSTDEEEYYQNFGGRGLILSSSAKKAVKGLLNQLPCGWPERGIPPLAPYRNEEVNLSIQKSIVK